MWKLTIILILSNARIQSLCFSFLIQPPTKTKPVTSSDFVLAKTTESFKLSDLYLLETKLQSQARNWTSPSLLGVDSQTGSYLIRLDSNFFGSSDSFSPSCCIDRFDWKGNVLASGSNGENLINDLIQKTEAKRIDDLECFTLDYYFMGKLKDKDYLSKNLIGRVSQIIQAPVALFPDISTTKLILIETVEKVYLVRKSSVMKKKNAANNMVKDLWSGRPYQYSSAINPTIGLIVVDILYDLCSLSMSKEKNQKRNSNDNSGRIKLVDLTCGSGTFLAYAIEKGMNVVGFDLNDRCIEGTKQNLSYLFDVPTVTNRTKLIACDSSSCDIIENNTFDCAVTNLPWGQNTEIKNKDDNLVSINILMSLP